MDLFTRNQVAGMTVFAMFTKLTNKVENVENSHDTSFFFTLIIGQIL